jgi:hypothetical protein
MEPHKKGIFQHRCIAAIVWGLLSAPSWNAKLEMGESSETDISYLSYLLISEAKLINFEFGAAAYGF